VRQRINAICGTCVCAAVFLSAAASPFLFFFRLFLLCHQLCCNAGVRGLFSKEEPQRRPFPYVGLSSLYQRPEEAKKKKTRKKTKNEHELKSVSAHVQPNAATADEHRKGCSLLQMMSFTPFLLLLIVLRWGKWLWSWQGCLVRAHIFSVFGAAKLSALPALLMCMNVCVHLTTQ
jgi:hypothetical protein